VSRLEQVYFIATEADELPSGIKHFLPLAQILAGKGHRVFLLIPQEKIVAGSRSENPALLLWPSHPFDYSRAILELLKLILKHRPHCLIASFSAAYPMTVAGFLERVPVRIIWKRSMTHCAEIVRRTSPRHPVRVWLEDRAKHIVHNLATQIICVSQAVLQDISRNYGIPESRLKMFHNTIVDPLPSLNKANGNSDRRHKLICIGGMSSLVKGQDVLIKTLGLLKNAYPDLSAEFIGRGKLLMDFYKNLARQLKIDDRCFFMGALPHSEVLERISAASVTVMPSRTEGFGYVCIEALAMGTPVVASRVDAIPEIIRDGVDGLLFRPEDAQDLADKLQTILSDSSLRERLSQKGRERFLTRFEQGCQLEIQACWLEDLVQKTLKGRKNTG
jgi:glycosyltransferase involved in cell wall biosynthesis